MLIILSYLNSISLLCLINPNTPVCLLQVVYDLNVYDILEPCYHSKKPSVITTGNSRLPMSFRKLGETERPLPVRKRMFGRAWPYKAPVRAGHVPTWPEILNSVEVPCTVSHSWCFVCSLMVLHWIPNLTNFISKRVDYSS